MKRFGNGEDKKNVVVSVMKDDEWLKVTEIGQRVRDAGYEIENRELAMFIYHDMENSHLESRKEKMKPGRWGKPTMTQLQVKEFRKKNRRSRS